MQPKIHLKNDTVQETAALQNPVFYLFYRFQTLLLDNTRQDVPNIKIKMLLQFYSSLNLKYLTKIPYKEVLQNDVIELSIFEIERRIMTSLPKNGDCKQQNG